MDSKSTATDAQREAYRALAQAFPQFQPREGA